MASLARDTECLVACWREASHSSREPGAKPALSKAAPNTEQNFEPRFKEWLQARGIDDTLKRQDDEDGWQVWRYLRDPVNPPGTKWMPAFHGIWWYSLWLILESGILCESTDEAKGHDPQSYPGVWCSPLLDTAKGYARAHHLFDDGAYHRCVVELRVNGNRLRLNREQGGVQWVFPSDAVALHGIRVQVNTPLKKGEQRVNEWDVKLQAVPRAWRDAAGMHVPGPWPPEGPPPTKMPLPVSLIQPEGPPPTKMPLTDPRDAS